MKRTGAVIVIILMILLSAVLIFHKNAARLLYSAGKKNIKTSPAVSECCLDAAHYMDRGNQEIMCALADLYLETNRPEKQAGILEQYASLYPRDPYPHHALGILYYRMKKFGPAEKELGIASGLSDTSSESLEANIVLGRLLIVSGRYGEGLDTLEKAMSRLKNLNKENPQKEVLFGMVLSAITINRNDPGIKEDRPGNIDQVSESINRARGYLEKKDYGSLEAELKKLMARLKKEPRSGDLPEINPREI
ncbi:MAG: hypothetical protein M1269_08315 [Chloroflexi bacterium]|nr:hypothetical protein [Chloroflexota bacterium]